MKPFQIAQSLRHIASGIDNSKNPKKDLVAKAIKQVISSISKQSARNVIVVHVHGDYEYTDVTQTSDVTLSRPFVSITLPKGDKIIFANSLADIKANMKVNETLLSALYNKGMIDPPDDEGNYNF
jgi:uncharacterized protein YjgD (DUF1641 family)